MKKLISIISVLIFIYIGCVKKAVEPDISELSENKVDMSVKDLYLNVSGTDTLFSDTTQTGINWKRYYKIICTKKSETWDDSSLSNPYLVEFYKKLGNSNEIFMGYIGNNFTSDTIYYKGKDQDTAKKVILNSDSIIKYDIPDENDFSPVLYKVIIKHNLEYNADSNYYFKGKDGFINQYIFTPIETKTKSEFVINSGDNYTVERVVNVKGQFDTTGVDYIYYYRFSAIQPFNIVTDKGVFDADEDENLYLKEGIYDTVFKSDSTIFGTLGRVDTLHKDSIFTSSFFDTIYSAGNTGGIGFEKKDTLLPYLGTKVIVLRTIDKKFIGFQDKYEPLYDFIDIRPFNYNLKVDKQRAQCLIKERENQLCILSDNIPVFFKTFGDTSYSDSVYFWIATRKLSSNFYDETREGLISSPTENVFQKWPDAIFETEPELFLLNSLGEIRADLLKNFDYKTGYRVSPLAKLNKIQDTYFGFNAQDFEVTKEIGLPTRSEEAGTYLGMMVKKGSILGYNEEDLDNFNALTYIYDTDILEDKLSGNGWHTIVDMDEVKKYSSFDNYLTSNYTIADTSNISKDYYTIAADFCYDYDKNLYNHSFRGLPLLSNGITDGEKEFIIIAYAKGKFFNEPRVIISKFTSKYTYVWDRIPPGFTWSITDDEGKYPQYDPSIDNEYAPLCYESESVSRCYGFFSKFDVYLSSLSENKKFSSVRDDGFGHIGSVRLGFGYSANYIGSDPLTGLRRYNSDSEPFYYELSLEEFKEIKGVYNDTKEESYTIIDAKFKNIDCSKWQIGKWDMWIETGDDLGNYGVAPYLSNYNKELGNEPVRKIEKR